MVTLWLAKLLLLFSMLGTLTLAEKSELLEENGQQNNIPGDQVAQIIPRHPGDEIETHSCHPDMCAILAELGAIHTRLAAAEREVQELRTENKALLVQLTVLTERMSNTECRLGQLMAVNSTVTELQRKVAVQGLEIQALRHRSNFTEAELREHRRELEELGRAKPKVAFAAALGDQEYVGPSDHAQILPFKKILTNVGNAYNPSTGVFIVPVRGIYYISFSTFTFGNNQANACLSLYRNDERLVTACDHASEDISDSASNGATLLLEKDDHVYIELHGQSMVFDDLLNRSCFRGFLIFQM